MQLAVNGEQANRLSNSTNHELPLPFAVLSPETATY
jgi:hypothetical protein